MYLKNLNVSSLTVSESTPFKISVHHCMNLRKISLEFASIKDDWLCKTISELPVLESLKLGYCHELKSIKISSSSLKKLKIKGCLEVVKLQIDTPNLSVFSFSGCMLSFSSNALALSNINLFLYGKHLVTPSQWYERYVEVLAQLNHFSEIFDLQVYHHEVYLCLLTSFVWDFLSLMIFFLSLNIFKFELYILNFFYEGSHHSRRIEANSTLPII